MKYVKSLCLVFAVFVLVSCSGDGEKELYSGSACIGEIVQKVTKGENTWYIVKSKMDTNLKHENVYAVVNEKTGYQLPGDGSYTDNSFVLPFLIDNNHPVYNALVPLNGSFFFQVKDATKDADNILNYSMYPSILVNQFITSIEGTYYDKEISNEAKNFYGLDTLSYTINFGEISPSDYGFPDDISESFSEFEPRDDFGL